MTEETQARFCPNCLGPAIRTGNEIACEKCDAIFVITKKQGATVKEIGPIKDHEERIQALEGKVQKDEPEKPEQESQEAEEDQDDDL